MFFSPYLYFFMCLSLLFSMLSCAAHDFLADGDQNAPKFHLCKSNVFWDSFLGEIMEVKVHDGATPVM